MKRRLGQIFHFVSLMVLAAIFSSGAIAAPRAELVMDMRTGEVIHAKNADTQLHPASLTKMMTLYVVFEAVEHGEISLDQKVTISAHAASEPPSKLGLKAGQKIALKYLIRAAAVKSANDAATALGEAISGSEAAFARRMNRTAKALGMTRTNFKNAHGLTESGHLSTARDMTVLGRHLFYDYPDYYNLFSRLTTDVPGKTLPNTNRRFLSAYKGADGIKTGYTNAAGFNLVASAERGSERVIATMFGGASTAARNARVAELLDLGFRKAPTHVAVNRPARPAYGGADGPAGTVTVTVAENGTTPRTAGKILRVVRAPERSIRPAPRPGAAEAPPADLVVALEAGIEAVIEDVVATAAALPGPSEAEAATTAAAPQASPAAPPRPAGIILTSVTPVPAPAVRPEKVTRLSTSGGRHWGINVGHFPSRDGADRMLIRTALAELASLDEALRKVVQTAEGYDANFVGLTQDGAALACRRLEARNTPCTVIGPPS